MMEMKINSTDTGLADKVFMVRPAQFGFNQQTAGTNAFQKQTAQQQDLHKAAISEFMQVVEKLDSKGIEVLVFASEDTEAPDSVFPNNWFSTHKNGQLVIYPMYAPNRRRERDDKAISMITDACNISSTLDLSGRENENKFLEGTGSIIFDHVARKAYAAIGPRTDRELFEELCQQLGFRRLIFDCVDTKGKDFYHTNVILHIGQDHAVLYENGIPEGEQKKSVIASLRQDKNEVISLSMEQVSAFCGNMLQVQNKRGDVFLLCSETSRKAFTPAQQRILERQAELIPFQIPTIEDIGGGSIRCMIAELF